jgi:hypothetical protein
MCHFSCSHHLQSFFLVAQQAYMKGTSFLQHVFQQAGMHFRITFLLLLQLWVIEGCSCSVPVTCWRSFSMCQLIANGQTTILSLKTVSLLCLIHLKSCNRGQVWMSRMHLISGWQPPLRQQALPMWANINSREIICRLVLLLNNDMTWAWMRLQWSLGSGWLLRR